MSTAHKILRKNRNYPAKTNNFLVIPQKNFDVTMKIAVSLKLFDGSVLIEMFFDKQLFTKQY